LRRGDDGQQGLAAAGCDGGEDVARLRLAGRDGGDGVGEAFLVRSERAGGQRATPRDIQ